MTAVLKFTGLMVRRPDSKMRENSFAYRTALKRLQAAIEADDASRAAIAEDQLNLIEAAFRDGVELGLKSTGEGVK